MKDYEKSEWAKSLEMDKGIVYDVCNHGNRHPHPEYIKDNPQKIALHNCCGCCSAKVLANYKKVAGSIKI